MAIWPSWSKIVTSKSLVISWIWKESCSSNSGMISKPVLPNLKKSRIRKHPKSIIWTNWWRSTRPSTTSLWNTGWFTRESFNPSIFSWWLTTGNTFPDSITFREKISSQIEDFNYFFKELNKNGVKVERRQLPLGDFLFLVKINFNNPILAANYESLDKIFYMRNNDKFNANNLNHSSEFVYDFIIERKISSDLCASITDGRYRDQLERLDTSFFTKVFYLVEGEFKNNISKPV